MNILSHLTYSIVYAHCLQMASTFTLFSVIFILCQAVKHIIHFFQQLLPTVCQHCTIICKPQQIYPFTSWILILCSSFSLIFSKACSKTYYYYTFLFSYFPTTDKLHGYTRKYCTFYSDVNLELRVKLNISISEARKSIYHFRQIVMYFDCNDLPCDTKICPKKF